MNKEQELLERARACMKLGEMTGSRGTAPSNVYNVLSDLIDALARHEQAEVVESIDYHAYRVAHIDPPGRASPPAVAAGGVTEAVLDKAFLDFIRGRDAAIDARPQMVDLNQVVRAGLREVLTAALAVGDDVKDTIDYVMRYGGRCRDCADENGTCPHSGLPCDTDAASKVIGFVLRAVDYGQRHGYLPTPPSRGEEGE